MYSKTCLDKGPQTQAIYESDSFKGPMMDLFGIKAEKKGANKLLCTSGSMFGQESTNFPSGLLYSLKGVFLFVLLPFQKGLRSRFQGVKIQLRT